MCQDLKLHYFNISRHSDDIFMHTLYYQDIASRIVSLDYTMVDFEGMKYKIMSQGSKMAFQVDKKKQIQLLQAWYNTYLFLGHKFARLNMIYEHTILKIQYNYNFMGIVYTFLLQYYKKDFQEGIQNMLKQLNSKLVDWEDMNQN